MKKNCGSEDLRVFWKLVNLQPNHHEDHIAGKGDNSLQHYNLVHKFIPMPQAMKIPAAKAAVDKEWEKLEKFSAWNLTKVRSKKDVIDEARTSGAKVHFASLMDICHLKNAELEAKHQKYKGRVVLRGDIVKDDSGSYAVFTEQGSSASQMTAAKVMDIISRLPGCDGQAADAVSAFSLIKMEDAHKLLKIPKSECQTFGFVYHDTNGLNHGRVLKTNVVPLERNLYGHPLAGLLCERQCGKIILKYGWEKVSNWECLFVHRQKGLFLSVYVDDIKLAGKKQNTNPMWKLLNKEVDLGEPTSFLDHVYLGCTKRQCEISKNIVDNYRTMFESRISAGGTEKLPNSENFCISSWSYDMEGHAKKCVERYCELANKTTQLNPKRQRDRKKFDDSDYLLEVKIHNRCCVCDWCDLILMCQCNSDCATKTMTDDNGNTGHLRASVAITLCVFYIYERYT